MGNGSLSWGRLNRGDLRDFDDIATNVVLYAMDHGGSGRLSRRGHVILRAPAGGTMSVPKRGTKSQQTLESTVRKLFGDEPTESSTTQSISADEQIQRIQETLAANPQLSCTVPNCEAVFVTQGAWYSHLHEKHTVCPEPGCNFARDNISAVKAHHRIVHLGIHPRRGTGNGRKRRRHASTPARVTKSSQVLDFIKSRPGQIVTSAEIHEAIPGLDTATIPNGFASKVGDWAKVERVAKGKYRFPAPSSKVIQVPALDDTKTPDTKTREPVVEPGNEMLAEIHAWVMKERDDLSARVAELEQMNAELRARLNAVTDALRGPSDT